MTTHSQRSCRWNTRAPWLSKLMLLNWLTPRYPRYLTTCYHGIHIANLFEASKANKPAHVSRPSIHTKFTTPLKLFNIPNTIVPSTNLKDIETTLTATTKPSLTPLINRRPGSLNASNWEEWRVKGFACFVMNLFPKEDSSGNSFKLIYLYLFYCKNLKN